MDAKDEAREKFGNFSKISAGLLLALLVSFASLAPGGPVENRDFSHLSRATFNGFNIILISLWLAGVVTVYLVWRGSRGASTAAVVIGWLYVIVVALDLGKVFPVSPDPTGFVLGLIMILDAILAFYVVLISHKALEHL